jgi:SPP1 gp7 family putative phage head morphogenesis protein
MARLPPEEKARREEEKMRRRREREQAREQKRREEAEEKARRRQEREDLRRQREIERGLKMKRRPRWLYWLIREQAAKRREHDLYMEAGRTALELGRAIRKIQRRYNAFLEPIINDVAKLDSPEARLVWIQAPWTPQDRTRYNWGKKKELEELWAQYPDGVVPQDPERAARDARRKTRARRIDRAKVMDRVLDQMLAELREDETAAVTSSLGRGYRRVYEDIYKELEDERRAIDADRAGASRVADIRDYTAKGNPRRTAPETRIPRNMPRLGSYGESVVFGAPSPDQVKAVLNAKFEGKDFSERIWKDTDKLAVEIKEAMTAAIINGENSQIVARRIADRMGVHYAHAERLVRTEMNRILNQAALDSMGDAGAESYVFVAIEDSRTCKRCLKLNRKKFKVRDKKIGVNCPPIHPRCRCTIMAHFAWMGDPDNVPDPKPSGMGGTQKTIEGWIKEAEARDAAMKAEEARQQAAIGLQRRAIQQGKAVKDEKILRRDLQNMRAQQDVGVARRSANRTTGDRDADRATTTQEEYMREKAREIKEEYQVKWTEKEKALIKELVASGRKCNSNDIVHIAKADAGGIIWMETGTKDAGLIHILKHQKELKARGIETKKIPRFTVEVIKNGEIVSGTKSKNGKEGLLLRYSEKLYIISIGDNGFIVGLYPVREGERYEKTSYDAGYNRAVALGLR